MQIAVDLMGSDSSPQVLLDSALLVASELSEKNALILLIQEDVFDKKTLHSLSLPYILCKEAVSTEDPPLFAVRRKKASTMAKGIELLREGKVEGFVSAGNTGVLMAMSLFQLGLIEGIQRPALLAELPSENGPICVLDVGANLHCKPSHLVQFAGLGSAYHTVLYANATPKVGLLNIGSESQKGTAELQKAYQKLKNYCQSPKVHMNFIGNIEGTEVFKGKVDVVVTDGFTGNVFLKTAEGVSGFILDYIKQVLFAHKEDSFPIIQEMQRYLNYAEYYGAVLAGLSGLVIKVHGYSSPKAFINGIYGALRLAKANFISKIKDSTLLHLSH